MTKFENIAEKISSQLLPRVEQPSQYVGLEISARKKPVESAEVTVAMAFPDAYTIGISHLGSQIVYHVLNDLDFVACDRTYCPRSDAEAVMRERSVPLFGWESRTPIRDFDIIGFTLAYELCVTNILTMLDLAGIELLAKDRGDDEPIIVGGDALADSPEPLADFFDVFIPGDGEQPMAALATLMREMKSQNLTRREKLLRITREIPSAYVPIFYQPDEFGCPRPTEDGVPATIQRAYLKKLADYPLHAKQLVPLCEAVQERVVVEVMRGCPNACRFCQAGHARLPVRRRSVDEIMTTIREAIDATGYDEVSLLSLSTGDYPNLDELITRINDEFAKRKISVSLPSLKVDKQLSELPKLTACVRKGGLTIAAEAGSERMRRAIKKDITEQNMLAGVAAAWEAGYKSVKVYFMAGLPGETEHDIEQIVYLCKRLSWTRKDFDGHKGAIGASVSWLVPKPHTPMQWEPMQRADYFWSVREKLIEMSRRSAVNVKFHRIEQSLLEALMCRGGREVGRTIMTAWRMGARMDSWQEHWDWALWQEAIAESGVDFDAIVHEPFDVDKPLPWSHIQCYWPTEKLLEQRNKMYEILDQ